MGCSPGETLCSPGGIERMDRPDAPIDGIYHYCDRWCERCTMAARCRLFAVERESEAREARGEDVNRAFWAAMRSVFGRERAGWKPSDTLATDETDAPYEVSDDDEALELDSSATWRESEGWGEFERAMACAPDPHPLAQAADAYLHAARGWHRRFGGLAAARKGATGDGIAFDDALEITRWYDVLILMKLTRAVRRKPWEDEDIDLLIAAAADGEPYEGPIPSDGDGSAKVAILAIERSFAAWSVLRDAFPEAEKATLALMRRLMRLRHAVDVEFPDARAFKRPGFDDD